MSLDLSLALSYFHDKPEDLTIKFKFDTSPFDKIYSCAIIDYVFDSSPSPGTKIPACSVLDANNAIVLFSDVSDTTLVLDIMLEFKSATTNPANP